MSSGFNGSSRSSSPPAPTRSGVVTTAAPPSGWRRPAPTQARFKPPLEWLPGCQAQGRDAGLGRHGLGPRRLLLASLGPRPRQGTRPRRREVHQPVRADDAAFDSKPGGRRGFAVKPDIPETCFATTDRRWVCFGRVVFPARAPRVWFRQGRDGPPQRSRDFPRCRSAPCHPEAWPEIAGVQGNRRPPR